MADTQNKAIDDLTNIIITQKARIDSLGFSEETRNYVDESAEKLKKSVNESVDESLHKLEIDYKAADVKVLSDAKNYTDGLLDVELELIFDDASILKIKVGNDD